MSKQKILILGSIIAVGFFSFYAFGMTVFDPKNFSVNTVTKANSVTQVSYQASMVTKQTQMVLNQIQQLKNEALNLTGLNVILNDPLYNDIRAIYSSIQQVKGVGYSTTTVQDKYKNIFYDIAINPQATHPNTVEGELQNQKLAVREEIVNGVATQAALVANSKAGISEVNTIMEKSRSASGNLEATQATNELLGQLISQDIKTQQMIAINGRMMAAQEAQMQGIEYAAIEKHEWNMQNFGKPSTAKSKPDIFLGK